MQAYKSVSRLTFSDDFDVALDARTLDFTVAVAFRSTNPAYFIPLYRRLAAHTQTLDKLSDHLWLDGLLLRGGPAFRRCYDV